jgi:hypothetical protein
VPTPLIAEALVKIPQAELLGAEEHHLGAPNHMRPVAAAILARVRVLGPKQEAISLGALYLVALQTLLHADPDMLRALHERTRAAAKEPLKPAPSLRADRAVPGRKPGQIGGGSV